MQTAKLERMLSQDLSYRSTEKDSFHKEAKKILRSLAKRLELSKGSFTIRSCEGGIAVPGEITLHHDNFYLQVFQNPFRTSGQVMIRTCNGQKDYTGGPNQFIDLNKLMTEDTIARLLKMKNIAA